MPHDRHLIKIIRHAVINDCVGFTAHAMKRMTERNIRRHMVIEALQRGKTPASLNPMRSTVQSNWS